jgi:diguanylate cyclase (GGDEF)-like protein
MNSKIPDTPADRTATPNKNVLQITHAYKHLLLILVALIPLIFIAYIYQFQNPALRFIDYTTHEYAIGIAILQSGFIGYVTWRCYLSSGEPLLRWLTLSFLSFTLIYAPHGFLTPLCGQNMALFLLYGPVSRLVMASFLLIGLITYGQPAHSPQQRTAPSFWLIWISTFLSIDALVAWIATSPGLPLQPIRLALESGSLMLLIGGVVWIWHRKLHTSIMTVYALSLAYLSESSLTFIIASPWNHLWWLAHLISACGFTVLSYGVIRAFHSTRSFSLVFSQEEVLEQLASAKAYAEEIARQLKAANESLEVLASTDPLTGLNNRRHFMAQSHAEFSRAMRTNSAFTILALDLDHFKNINDQYGHPVGDEVLKCFASAASAQLRPTDHIGRVGGEEFMILLVDTHGAEAHTIAERIRNAVEKINIPAAGTMIRITVSVGLSEFTSDCKHLEEILSKADECLYQAKKLGRNQVAHYSKKLSENLNIAHAAG